jgi:hypothetical protein
MNLYDYWNSNAQNKLMSLLNNTTPSYVDIISFLKIEKANLNIHQIGNVKITLSIWEELEFVIV